MVFAPLSFICVRGLPCVNKRFLFILPQKNKKINSICRTELNLSKKSKGYRLTTDQVLINITIINRFSL